MDEAQKVLAAIAEAHAAADAGLKVGGGPAHVEGDHALVLVPDVHLTVELFVVRPDDEVRQKAQPVFFELLEPGIKLLGGLKLLEQLVSVVLVDDVRGDKLMILRALAVAQDEHVGNGFAGLQRLAQAVAGDGRPAPGVGVAGLVLHDGVGAVKAVVQADEALPVGIVAVHGGVDGVHRVMVAALAVFGLVVDDGAALFKLHLGQGVVALEVGAVVLGVPQAELHEAVQADFLFGVRLVGQRQLRDLGPRAAGHHGGLLGLEAVLLAGDHGIAQAVAAGIFIQRGLDRLPAGVPDDAAVIDVKVFSARVGRHVVVAVAGQAQKPGVLIERVAARGIAEQGEKVLAAQVVDPGVRSIRPGDDKLTLCVVKISVLHTQLPPENN